MRLIIVVLISFTYLFARMTDDKAYKEYKRGHYKRAFELYKKSGTTKADYNLAVFYEQGIGTAKNKQKALEYYKKVYNAIDYNMNFNNYKICNAMLPYYYKALKKLDKKEELQKLKTKCAKEKNPFFAKCPVARVIPKNSRATLNDFECFYYKRFPKSMKRLLGIHAKIKSYDSVWEPKLVKKYKPQMIKAIKPIIKYYIHKETKCINRAKRNENVENCLYEYLNFLHKAFLSQQIADDTIMFLRDEAKRNPKARQELNERNRRAKERKRYLQQIATKEEKTKALKELKTLHKTIEDYYQ